MPPFRIEGFVPSADHDFTRVEVDGTAVAVAIVDGTVHAVDDLCTHRQCSLSDGDLDDGAVVCPCHEGRFDLRTGAVLAGPPPAPIGVWRPTLTDGVLELDR